MALSKSEKETRRLGIGGSDVAAILGLDPFGRQAIDVFYDKLPELAEEHGFVPATVDAESDAIILGNCLEAGIAEAYSLRTGRKIRRSNKNHTHPKYTFLRAFVDRLIVGERRGLEIKNVGYRMASKWGPSGTDEVAEYYLPQVHHYMLVLDYPVWDVAAAIGGNEIRIYTIERDPEWDEIIIDACSEFWGYVERKEPPPIDLGSPYASDTVKRVYTGTNGSTVYLDETVMYWAKVMGDAKEHIKRYQKAVDTAKAHILYMMGDASIGVLPDGTGFTRKLVRRKGYKVQAKEYIDLRFSKNLGGK